LYGCETSIFVLRRKHKIRRRCRKLHNEKLHGSCGIRISQRKFIFPNSKKKKILGSMKGKYYLGDLGIDGAWN
jgi:hypothetical protein